MKYRFYNHKVRAEALSWKQGNSPLYKKAVDLAKDAAKDYEYFDGCGREPQNGSKGLGKPERLTENLSGWYSRRITEQDRLVYRVEGGVFVIRNLKDHYTSLSSTLWDSQLDEAFAVSNLS